LDLPAVLAPSFQWAAAAMILSDLAKKSETARRRVEVFVLDHPRLGDPRLPHNIPKWIGVDSAAERWPFLDNRFGIALCSSRP